ncbi:MAG: DUF4349 domain-containing protein [Myxococcota bacterium]
MSRVLLLAALSMGLGSTPAFAQDTPDDKELTTSDSSDLTGSSVTAGVTVTVADRKAAATAAVELAESKNGWFASFTPEMVSLRVPTNDTADVLDALRELGDVVAREYSRTDHSAEIAELDARIAGREKVLEKYMKVLATARAKSVVAVEREITNAIGELERLKGRRRYLQARLDHSQVTVRFIFRDRTAPRRTGGSSFAWLNTMNMADVERDFQSGNRAAKSRTTVRAPEGFAPFKRPTRFQAVSADDVLYRVRSVRHKPKAELTFWKEALRTRMVEAGYKVLSEETAANGTYLLELGAANGPKDQTYLIGIKVTDWHLIIAEATGEAEAFRPHRAALLQSMQTLRD